MKEEHDKEGLKLSKNTIIKWSKDYVSPAIIPPHQPEQKANMDNGLNRENLLPTSPNHKQVWIMDLTGKPRKFICRNHYYISAKREGNMTLIMLNWKGYRISNLNNMVL